ncbi:hypothetical protein E6C60_3642 [Paenibacillus algicola]|uniref:Uncharacterized protein n=1 Tax=Paenibacillus algicola TaxID=2565926 RepID=A0A4P8XNC7_9BACL|nr:hypothetical protein [Paenibacillus algicola]QCT04352.1 hypothetical protein E6C60_3642 [Paenibacillus algicola]
MENLVFSKAMSMHVTTYKILNDKGEQLVSLLQQFFDLFLGYIEEDLDIMIEFMKGKEKTMQINNKNISKVYDYFLQGKIECLDIFHYYDLHDEAMDRHYPGLYTVGISCNQASTYSPELAKSRIFPNNFSLSLNERLFNNYIPSHVQNDFVDLFKQAIILLEGVTGFITYESTAASSHTRTPFETHWSIDTSSPPGYTQRLRGYFWLNYLSTHHINQLGGLDCIRKNAPCGVIESLDQQDKLGLLLGLTDNINDYSDDQLRKLREYFWPLLGIEDNNEHVPSFEYPPRYIARLVE